LEKSILRVALETRSMIVAVTIIMVAIAAGYYFYQMSPQEPTTSPSPTSTPTVTPDVTPTPTPPRWHLMMVSAFLWEDARELFVAGSHSDLTEYLLHTLQRINVQARCVFDDEQVEEIEKSMKVMRLRFRFYDDINISQWIEPEDRDHIKTNETGYRILEKVKYAIFILDSNKNESLIGLILIKSYSSSEDYWGCWAVEKDGQLDTSWIVEIERFLLTPTEIYLPFKNGTESKLLLIDSHLSYGVFEENITIIPKGRSATIGDPAVIIKGKVINHYDEGYYFAITCDLYNSQGQKLEGAEYIFNPPVGEFTVTYVNDHGPFEIYLKYEGQDITHYELFLAFEPQINPPA
jgi:hypothetical protein